MSAPVFETKAADYIGQGFLAIKAKNAIGVFLNGQTLTDSERDILFKAQKFLKDIASGASLVATGEVNGIRPMESMAALDYAMDPIQRLKGLLGDREVSDFFNEVAESVELGAKGAPDVLPAREQTLRFAVSFFDMLYLSLSSALNRNHHPLGGNIERTHALA